MKQKILSFFIFLNLIFVHLSAAAANVINPIDIQKLRSGDQVLKVGYIADFPPFYYQNASKGLDPDIFYKVTQRAEIKKISYKKFSNFDELNQALNTGEIDIIVSDYWDIPSHRKLFLPTKPYYNKGGIGVIFLKDKHNFTSLSDLQGYKMGVPKNETDVVTWIKATLPQANLTVYPTRSAMMNDLKENKIDAGFIYYSHFITYVHPEEEQYSAILVKRINSVYAMRKQDIQLQKLLNKEIKSMWSDKTMNEIIKKYVNE